MYSIIVCNSTVWLSLVRLAEFGDLAEFDGLAEFG